MGINFLIERFENNKTDTSLIWKGEYISYGALLEKYNSSKLFLQDNNIKTGEVISLTSDFTPNTIALMLALIQNKNIIVPLSVNAKETERIKFEIAAVQKNILVNVDDDSYVIEQLSVSGDHSFYDKLRSRNSPGLVLFTSGTSGFPKGAVHDFDKLLAKFRKPRTSFRTINFLLFDHWGGLNTMFHTLSNCGVVLALRNRKPDAVCQFIEKYKIELLPVSPSFLNLLIMSGEFVKFNLSSIKIITYGTEPMPESTLIRAKELFPNVTFQQTYGLIELGVLRSKSEEGNSLWVKLGGEGYELRVIDNILQIKAESAMLGYLNADSPFTDDGYFITGDMVEQKGEYYKILGRKSELINIGGDKVYPQEVENIILDYKNIADVTVYGERHPITGNIVCAKINLIDAVEDEKEFIKSLKKYCRQNLQPFKVPVKIFVINEMLHSKRFKKQRQNGTE